MERKESRNGLELIKFAAIRLKGNFCAVFMGVFAMVTPLALILLVPFIISLLTDVSWVMSIGVVLFAILVGPVQMGHIRYFNHVLEGKQPNLIEIYSCVRFNIFTLRTIYISLLLILMYIVGGVLWIVPAGFAISFYSMTLYFLERNENSRLSGAMNECSRYMIGNRLAMFSYKLIFYFLYFCLFVIGALSLALVVLLSMDSLVISWIIAVCSAIIFIFLYTIVTIYYHSANQIFFEDVLMYHERKKAQKSQTKSADVATVTKEEKSKIKNKKDKKKKEIKLDQDKNEGDSQLEKVEKAKEPNKSKQDKKQKSKKEKPTKKDKKEEKLEVKDKE